MENQYSEKEIKDTIDKILFVLENNFRSNYSKDKIPYVQIAEFIQDLSNLYEIYSELNKKECGRSIITRYIKLIDFVITLDNNDKNKRIYLKCLENAYKLAARVSLEHFIVYYEWENEDKLYENRVEILQPYVYYLNKMCFDRTFEGMIVNLPSRIWKI